MRLALHPISTLCFLVVLKVPKAIQLAYSKSAYSRLRTRMLFFYYKQYKDFESK